MLHYYEGKLEKRILLCLNNIQDMLKTEFKGGDKRSDFFLNNISLEKTEDKRVHVKLQNHHRTTKFEDEIEKKSDGT